MISDQQRTVLFLEALNQDDAAESRKIQARITARRATIRDIEEWLIPQPQTPTQPEPDTAHDTPEAARDAAERQSLVAPAGEYCAHLGRNVSVPCYPGSALPGACVAVSCRVKMFSHAAAILATQRERTFARGDTKQPGSEGV